MKNFIQLIIITVCFLSQISCQKHPNYQSIISNRAQRDTTLSYNGICLGDSIAKYGPADKTLINITDEYISLPDVNSKNNVMQIVGNIPAHISIEQHNESRKIDAIAIVLNGNENTLESLVYKYINLYGMYSYYENYEGTPNLQKDKYIPYNDALSAPEIILNNAMATMQNIDIDHSRFKFVWEWKNQSISISCISSDNIYITLYNN